MCLLTRFAINTGSSKLISYCHTALAALQNILIFNMLKHWQNGDFLNLELYIANCVFVEGYSISTEMSYDSCKNNFWKTVNASSDLAWCASLATVSFQVCCEDGQLYMYLLPKEEQHDWPTIYYLSHEFQK